MVRYHLSEDQEQEAKLLESKIRLAVDQEISNLARLLSGSGGPCLRDRDETRAT
jgi:hypothetical protein